MEKTARCYEQLERLRKADEESFEAIQMKATAVNQEAITFFKLKRISSDKDFPHEQALENVFSLYKNSKARMIYYLRSDGQHIHLYMGVRNMKEPDPQDTKLADMLSGTLLGNFRGSQLEGPLPGKDVCAQLCNSKLRFSSVLGVPSCAAQAEEREFHTMDHVLHAMNGKPFHIVVVWEAMDDKQLLDTENKLLSIYDELLPLAAGSKSKAVQTSNSLEQGKKSTSSSDSSNINWCDKNLQIWLKAIEDELLPRMRTGKAKGMFLSSVYLGAETDEALALLESSFVSVFQNYSPSFAPLRAVRLPINQSCRQVIANADIVTDLRASASWLALHSRQLNNGFTSMATCLTARELSIIAGYPHGDVPGIEISKRVSFGLNIPSNQGMLLGKLLQDGGELGIDVRIPASDLERHVFIAGTTGSGKTTTCHRILSEFGKGFMVIEPAKTEYRTLLNDRSMKDLYIFTVGNESGVPFRMNPFEFLPTENISAHIDMLKACFMASFELEAAMPNLMEEAMYRLYDKFGWEVSDNSNRFLGLKRNHAWKEGYKGIFFPTISDYVSMVVQVIESKEFDERLKNDYIGSIRGRLDSMTVGVKGLMLNIRRSIDFDWLLDQKVVIELEELKSGEDKAFVMALIIGRLLEALKARYQKEQKTGTDFRHILLIEEAHRLLSQVEGASNGRRLGIEMFTDMLAEVRKYHESLIIVDQIPSKLASEVLKNTNTKIVHRLFAEEDKRAIGNAMALSHEQCEFLSQLDIGETIISGNGWRKPVHVHIARLGDTENTVSEERAFLNGNVFWDRNVRLFCPAFPYYERQNLSHGQLVAMCNAGHRVREMISLFDDLTFSRWLELRTWLKGKVGDTPAYDFLRMSLWSEIFVLQMIKTKAMNFDLKARQESIEEIAEQLLAGDEQSFKKAMSKIC